MSRHLIARMLVVVASVAVVLALLVGYARRAAVDSEQFANRATAALRDDSVRSLIAQRITDEVVLKNQENLTAARPLVESVASAVVGSRAFTGLFHSAVRDVHRALFDRDRNTVTLTVADVGTVLGAALQTVRPSLARQVKSTGRVELVKRNLGTLSGDLARLADKVRVLALLLAGLTVVLVAGAVAASPDRRRTVVELGIGAAAGGVLVVVAYGVARSLAVHHVDGPENQAAAGAVWDAFLGDLRTAAWILSGSGAMIAAAAASLIRPVDVREPLLRAAAWLTTEPRRPALRVLRAIAFVAVGLVVLVERDAVLAFLLTVVGVFLIYEGVTALLRLVYRAPAPSVEPAPHGPGLVRRALVIGIPAALIVAAVAAFVGTGGTTTAAPAQFACNGHEALCDRPLDRVVLPATHNSMSVPLPGWYSSEQDRPIADQLTDGVRGLLVDTHYADRLPNGKLRTYFGSREELRRQAREDGVNPDAVDAASRIREQLGFAGEGERGMYLCHTFCELGATPLGSVLDDLRAFLVSHPGEVLVVINQDYVTPADYVGAIKDAGLEDLVYRGPVTGTWLTLREMIDRNQRVLFLAENHAGAAPWYHLAYEQVTEETPYKFSKVPQLTDPDGLAATCKPNRGPDHAPLFLVNHWISTDPLPLPSQATEVNARGPLLRRARECQDVRKHLPNLLAVNFYRRGALFRVVDTLNGVR
ncbi:MAG: hypothetical protein QOD13_1657 [Thermoleophilaceae bacterium]|jgi:hypothetical protein|nr:hypothetical protein [Thermoleophilaceae bacterium]